MLDPVIDFDANFYETQPVLDHRRSSHSDPASRTRSHRPAAQPTILPCPPGIHPRRMIRDRRRYIQCFPTWAEVTSIGPSGLWKRRTLAYLVGDSPAILLG